MHTYGYRRLLGLRPAISTNLRNVPPLFWLQHAVSDPQRRLLFKTADVARFLGCTSNSLAMYLKRRKVFHSSGIYQATHFLCRQDVARDLKRGCYFLSLEVCERLKRLMELKRRDRVFVSIDGNTNSGQPFPKY